MFKNISFWEWILGMDAANLMNGITHNLNFKIANNIYIYIYMHYLLWTFDD